VSHSARNGLTSTQTFQTHSRVGNYVESGSAVDRFYIESEKYRGI